MKKKSNLIYWITTGFLSLGMLAGGIQQLLQVGGYVEIVVNRLGYPLYFLSILGAWKIVGVIAILIPRFTLLKEWAYAGFFFAMSGAVASHLLMNEPMVEVIPSLILLLVTTVSWYFRPKNRKISFLHS
jgi:uncharacterized membrane protein